MNSAHEQVLFGYHLDAMRMSEVVAECERAIACRQRLLIGVVNAAKIVNSSRDNLLQQSLLECDLLLADGQSVVWASRLLKRPVPERVAGIDLFEELLQTADLVGRSVYLLGARPEVLEQVCANIRIRLPGVRIVGAHHGFFTDEQAPAVAADIRRSGADMIFLGMTSPKKEIFLGTFGASLRVPVQHGVGGSFDIYAGITKRAPVLWQRMGLEWLYRVFQEPGRMWRRYLTTNVAFVRLVLAERHSPAPVMARRTVFGASHVSIEDVRPVSATWNTGAAGAGELRQRQMGA